MSHTRSQMLAYAAFPAVEAAKRDLTAANFKESTSFAKKFPSLVHACGLAQTVAFAMAKKENDYVASLAKVMKASGHYEITDGGAPTAMPELSP